MSQVFCFVFFFVYVYLCKGIFYIIMYVPRYLKSCSQHSVLKTIVDTYIIGLQTTLYDVFNTGFSHRAVE